MSKSNRIKGAFDVVLGCRNASPQRMFSLAQRAEGLTERHQPKPQQQGSSRQLKQFSGTKAQRKLWKSISKMRTESMPVGHKGMGIILGLVNRATANG